MQMSNYRRIQWVAFTIGLMGLQSTKGNELEMPLGGHLANDEYDPVSAQLHIKSALELVETKDS